MTFSRTLSSTVIIEVGPSTRRALVEWDEEKISKSLTSLARSSSKSLTGLEGIYFYHQRDLANRAKMEGIRRSSSAPSLPTQTLTRISSTSSLPSDFEPLSSCKTGNSAASKVLEQVLVTTWAVPFLLLFVYGLFVMLLLNKTSQSSHLPLL